jgi:O-antigen ligase
MLGPLFEMARAFMPFGSGFGSFDSVYRHFEPNSLLSTIYMNEAHDEPVQLAIEGGVPALLLLGLFLVWWARAAVTCLRRPLQTRRRAMGDAAVIMTVILMASSLVDYPLRTPLLGAVFVFACIEMIFSADSQPLAPWQARGRAA